MAVDAEVQIPAAPEAPVADAPVDQVEQAPIAEELVADATVEPVAVEALPVVEPAAPAARPARKPRAVKTAAAKVAPVLPASAPAKAKVRAAKPRKAAPRPAAKATRSSPPAAMPAPQAATAPVASRRVAKRKTAPTRQTPKIGQGKPKFALKDKFMAISFDLTKIQTAFTDIQGKAKAALDKGTAALGDANAFAKGNVEAVVASGKILSAGLQDLGATFVTESRGAFEGLTADAKELAAAKSPTEFFQLQSALVRKQFDGAVAQASKNTEAWLKLTNETFAPLSSRVTLAVEKVSKAA